ncbi:MULTISPECIES: glycosyltransferase [unclassified Synechococcus]|uniref:glycosyltransferase n=1 Tax=unclassified Synechococcus TaxID=2626047 RepID=UPI000903B953|nr:MULTISPECIES: glycosyltransferase [unclassified Synechococcus]WFN59514.1 glycosyltransferase [Synechococcus sp. CCFWC 502]
MKPLLRATALVYRPDGFRAIGGIRRLAMEVVRQQDPSSCCVVVARSSLADQLDGGLPGIPVVRKLHGVSRMLIFGCDSPWAYGLVVRTRLLRPSLKIGWLPSFHDPSSVSHAWRARLAQLALKATQSWGITVYAQTSHERKLLDGGLCQLSSHGLPADVKEKLAGRLDLGRFSATSPRPVDLLFLGRPTRQKGWMRFLTLARLTRLHCLAIVPFEPTTDNIPENVQLVIRPSDDAIQACLSRSKVVIIPADYESFGIAQLEAVAAGCAVPLLGRWPLWDHFHHLHWQGCRDDVLAERLRRLCRSPRLLQRIAHQQAQYIFYHPITSTAFLPGF